MKRCPSCTRTYTDDSLAFCLEDGSTLLSDASSSPALAATLIIPEPRATTPARAEYASPGPQPHQPPAPLYPATPPAWIAAGNSPAFPGTTSPQGRGLAMASLICAIAAFALLGFCIIGGATGVDASLIGGIFIFSALLALVGALLGIVVLVKQSRDTSPRSSRMLGLVGLILNGIYLTIVIIFLVIGAVASSH